MVNEYRTIYWNISRNDALLEELHSLLDPLAKEFHPLPEINIPPAPSEQSNNTNRNTGSGIRRKRRQRRGRSRRGGNLASSVLPILTSFALF